MASSLNPSAKGASSDELLAEISRLQELQEDDAFCGALGKWNLANQERVVRALLAASCIPESTPLFSRLSLRPAPWMSRMGFLGCVPEMRQVDMRDWVGVVDRINDILTRAQAAVPNVLDDSVQLATAEHKAANHVKICLAFCVGLLTNAQHKRFFWDFTVRGAPSAHRRQCKLRELPHSFLGLLGCCKHTQHIKRLLGAVDLDIVQLALEVLFAYSVRTCFRVTTSACIGDFTMR